MALFFDLADVHRSNHRPDGESRYHQTAHQDILKDLRKPVTINSQEKAKRLPLHTERSAELRSQCSHRLSVATSTCLSTTRFKSKSADLSFSTAKPAGEGDRMVDEGTLRKKAREAIQTKRLPDRHPVRTFGGNGFGTECAICGVTVAPDQVGYELEFDEPPGEESPTYHVHVRCFGAWELERHLTSSSQA